MDIIRNSKEEYLRLKQLNWNGGTETHTDTQTDRPLYWVALCGYAQLIKSWQWSCSLYIRTLTGPASEFLPSTTLELWQYTRISGHSPPPNPLPYSPQHNPASPTNHPPPHTIHHETTTTKPPPPTHHYLHTTTHPPTNTHPIPLTTPNFVGEKFLRQDMG